MSATEKIRELKIMAIDDLPMPGASSLISMAAPVILSLIAEHGPKLLGKAFDYFTGATSN
jgi:hypothetical protein